eukprot:superscaffoldBa00007647_g22717
MKMDEVLLNVLQGLGKEDFKTFKWHLQKGDSPIPKSKLEKADETDTVDLMVQKYESSGAVDVAKEVLKKINRNDLVQRLSDSSTEPKAVLDLPPLRLLILPPAGRLMGEMKTKEDLLKTLEDLIGKDFEDFKWFLKHESLEGHQAIKASQLEKAERRDTVDLMVQTYQLPGAVEVTKKLLKKINRNDLLQSSSDSSPGPE